jgi:hypothetical protein
MSVCVPGSLPGFVDTVTTVARAEGHPPNRGPSILRLARGDPLRPTFEIPYLVDSPLLGESRR